MPDGRWDRFFEDLEHQFAAELDTERDEIASESERVRIARLGIRDRLVAAGPGADAAIEVGGAEPLHIVVESVGRDWMAGSQGEGGALVVLPLASIDGFALDRSGLSRSVKAVTEDPLTARITFGFVLRSLARRRVHVTLVRRRAAALAGTPQRAGADHLDIALRDQDAAPRAGDVRAVQTVGFPAIAWVRLARRTDLGVI
ncbi:hypothetical protein [Microbacterium sp. G2-8]|uniref:hypothetical protein n=1 Tax=Microbacterium sp. G2-8 TaxID=2842454 RepID=UPI001C8AB7E0|nr:hypothetical protein [Microbacterium sp. G2-8]